MKKFENWSSNYKACKHFETEFRSALEDTYTELQINEFIDNNWHAECLSAMEGDAVDPNESREHYIKEWVYVEVSRLRPPPPKTYGPHVKIVRNIRLISTDKSKVGEAQGMLDENGFVIGYWPLRDAMWQNEHFESFLSHLGIEIRTGSTTKKDAAKLKRYIKDLVGG